MTDSHAVLIPDAADGRQQADEGANSRQCDDLDDSLSISEEEDSDVTENAIHQIQAAEEELPEVVGEAFLHDFDHIEMQKKQEECPEFGPIIFYLQTGELPLDGKKARTIALTATQYFLEEGILYHLPYSTRNAKRAPLLDKQLCVPVSLRSDLLKSRHEVSGHAGSRRLYLSLSTTFYWCSMFSDARIYATSCHSCQKNKVSTQTHKVPLKSINNEQLFNVWSIDVLKMPKSHQGNTLALVCVENFSLWPEITPLRNETAPEVANALLNSIFARHGVPVSLLSDNASNFKSKIMSEVCRMLKIKRLLTASYRPQADPAELQNKLVLQTLRCVAENEDASWEDNLPAVLLAHRSTPSPSRADLSPYQLLYGRTMNTPAEMEYDVSRNAKMSVASKEYLSKLVEKLRLAHELAKEQIKLTQLQNKKFYDRDAKAVSYAEGELVWLRKEKTEPGRARKLQNRYDGPFFVSSKIGENSYLLRDSKTKQLLKASVNADRLKLVVDRTTLSSFHKVEEELANDDDEQEQENQEARTDVDSPEEDDQRSEDDKVVTKTSPHQIKPVQPVAQSIDKEILSPDTVDELKGLLQRRNAQTNEVAERRNTRYNLRTCPKRNVQRKHIIKVIKKAKRGDTDMAYVKFEDGTSGFVPTRDVDDEVLNKFYINKDKKKHARKNLL
jgi:transposase InsO family protein